MATRKTARKAASKTSRKAARKTAKSPAKKTAKAAKKGTGKGRGGPRPGSGRPRIAVGGRAYMREIVDDPARRKLFEQSIDAALRGGDPMPFIRAFEHGYGRAPQALDVKVSGEVQYVVVTGVPRDPDAPVGGTD